MIKQNESAGRDSLAKLRSDSVCQHSRALFVGSAASEFLQKNSIVRTNKVGRKEVGTRQLQMFTKN